MSINAKFKQAKTYNDTWKNIFCAVYDTLDLHVHNAFKITPATAPGTVGWNSTMLLNDIFNRVTRLDSLGQTTSSTSRQVTSSAGRQCIK